MSRSVNIFALFGILSMAACIAMAPPSMHEQPSQQDTLGCGVVGFIVTTYLPRPHTDAFCSAYLQVPQASYEHLPTPAPTTQRDGHSLVAASTHKAFRQATIPEFNWLRARKSQTPPRSTVLGKACSCLETLRASNLQSTSVAAPTAPLAAREENSALMATTSIFQTPLTHVSRGNYGNTIAASPPSQATKEAAVFRKRTVDPVEQELRLVSQRLGIASAMMMNTESAPTLNITLRSSDVLGGRLGLLKALGSSV